MNLKRIILFWVKISFMNSFPLSSTKIHRHYSNLFTRKQRPAKFKEEIITQSNGTQVIQFQIIIHKSQDAKQLQVNIQFQSLAFHFNQFKLN